MKARSRHYLHLRQLNRVRLDEDLALRANEIAKQVSDALAGN